MTERSSFFERAFAPEPPIRLFEEDPELFERLSPQAQLEARSHAVAPALRLETGRCDARLTAVPAGTHLGLLVVEGILMRSVVVAEHPRSELLGPGDVIRPWEDDEVGASLPFEARWEAIRPVRLAVLDERLLASACRWPEAISAIVGRAVRRSRWLALQLAIADIRRIDDRLMLLFWHFADRWGRVSPEGVVVSLPVTHEVISQLIGAQRPTVTGALQRLSTAGLLRRLPERRWLLAPEPPRGLVRDRVAERSAPAHRSPTNPAERRDVSRLP